MPNSRRGRAALAVLVAALCAACSGGAAPRVARSPAAATQGASPASAPAMSLPPSPAVPSPGSPPAQASSPPASPSPAPDSFVATAAAVTAGELGASWRPGCPVGPAQLSALTLSYWGFDNQPHLGTLIVNSAVAGPVESVFRQLFDERFPIRQMVPVSAYGGSDAASAAADNTAGFNCRTAIAPGPPHWSEHAYGLAIDVDTVENPYLEGGQILPPNGAPYVTRSDVRPGMAVPGGQLVAAFRSIGWGWGGNWAGTPDYQHFSSDGH
jgi:hypothetical protein